MKYLICLLALTGCIYRMPSDDHLALSPNTNNPAVTQEKPSSMIPGKDLQ